MGVKRNLSRPGARFRILAALMVERGLGWLSGDRLIEIASEGEERVSRATVYRILADIERLGILSIERRPASQGGGARSRKIFIPVDRDNVAKRKARRLPSRPARLTGEQSFTVEILEKRP